jgi:molecular chaperone Hsp33
MSEEAAPLEIRTYFVRHRNALLARADFSQLWIDYYLHLADTGQRLDPEDDARFKDVTAALCLHAAGRPWNERIAWTLHFEDPLRNFFVTADNPLGHVTGTCFAEDVKSKGQDLFYADVLAGQKEPRRSVVELSHGTILENVAQFYHQSEQRPARFFHHSEEDLVLVSAQPDCDEEWLAGLTVEDIRSLDRREELSLLEQRFFHWRCGCSEERMLAVLAPTMRVDPAALFADEDSLRMRCPRCGQRYVITREAMECFLAKAGAAGS